MNSNTVWSGENIIIADLRPSMSSTFFTSFEAMQASPPRDQSICRNARASTFAAWKAPMLMGSSSTVCQTKSTSPSLQRLVLAGRVLDEHDLQSSPSAAAAEPGCVVEPAVAEHQRHVPGHCDSATL